MADNAMPTGPGSFCWFELMTGDTGKAGAFYTKLFGWTTEEMNMGDFTYTVFKRDGAPVAGMMSFPPGMDGVPPHWLTYVAVANCDAAAAQARELGGTICKPPEDIPNIGRFAVVQDPAGATFCLFQGIG